MSAELVRLKVMRHILIFQGRQFPDANLPGVSFDQTKAIFEAAIKTLVHLQSLNTDHLNIDGIGDKENYFQRRVNEMCCSNGTSS